MVSKDYLCERFESALYPLPERLKNILLCVPERIKSCAEEIRLRAGKPLLLTVGGAPMWVDRGGGAGYLPPARPVFVTGEELECVFSALCNRSVYRHAEEIKEGYIRMKGSHRAGICGTLTENGIRDLSSVNIRIARQIIGCADGILSRYDGGGLLIAGPPGCGKTTVLRDTVRQLSSLHKKRVAVIDCRGEIAACERGVPQNDIGDNSDVLQGVDKAGGLERAVRTLCPQIVAFDEIGALAEVEKIILGLCSGVSVVTTAHAGGKSDLAGRRVIKSLLSCGAVSQVAFLKSVGCAAEMFGAKEILSLCGR